MTGLIHARGLHKQFGRHEVLKDIHLDIQGGEIVGLIGPNGAGKTTLLKSILGLAPVDGNLEVLGLNPVARRAELMQKVSFIADTATLPSWMKVGEAIDFMNSLHPRFSEQKARDYLVNTNIPMDKKISQLSKGMITKTHLSLVMAIDSELLVLDEPTLGLDIVKRKEFYQQLLGDYFDDEKTILITTHQVEEVEHILTRAVFIDDGQIVLDESIEDINTRYCELHVDKARRHEAEALGPIFHSETIQATHYLYYDADVEALQALGKVHTPSLADLFVAKVSRQGAR